MAVKTDFEVAREFAQGALNATPVIILGSGASAAHGVPGMGPLAGRLAASVTPRVWALDETAEWDRFLEQLTAGDDLESALQAVRLTDRQTNFVAEETRSFLLPTGRVFGTRSRRHLALEEGGGGARATHDQPAGLDIPRSRSGSSTSYSI